MLPTVFRRSGKKNSFDGDKPVTLTQTNLVEFCCKQCSIPCHCDLKIKYQHTIKKYSTSSEKTHGKISEDYMNVLLQMAVIIRGFKSSKIWSAAWNYSLVRSYIGIPTCGSTLTVPLYWTQFNASLAGYHPIQGHVLAQ